MKLKKSRRRRRRSWAGGKPGHPGDALGHGRRRRPKLVVGFAAETSDLEANARAKLQRKGCDWIVANDVSRPAVMGGDENEVLLV